MFVVKVASSRWPMKRVGNRGTLHTLKKTYSDLHNFTADRITRIGKESLEAARYTPPNSQDSFDNDDEEDDEVVAAVKRAIDSKREKYNLKARSSTSQKAKSQQSFDDNDVEGLAAGIFKMDFNKS